MYFAFQVKPIEVFKTLQMYFVFRSHSIDVLLHSIDLRCISFQFHRCIPTFYRCTQYFCLSPYMNNNDLQMHVVFRSKPIDVPCNSIGVRRISDNCHRCTLNFYRCMLCFCGFPLMYSTLLQMYVVFLSSSRDVFQNYIKVRCISVEIHRCNLQNVQMCVKTHWFS